MPAAFIGGLFYGFSPFVLTNLTSSHIDLTLVAIPPLVIICLEELLIRQRRNPVTTGVVLGVLRACSSWWGPRSSCCWSSRRASPSC